MYQRERENVYVKTFAVILDVLDKAHSTSNNADNVTTISRLHKKWQNLVFIPYKMLPVTNDHTRVVKMMVVIVMTFYHSLTT